MTNRVGLSRCLAFIGAWLFIWGAATSVVDYALADGWLCAACLVLFIAYCVNA